MNLHFRGVKLRLFFPNLSTLLLMPVLILLTACEPEPTPRPVELRPNATPEMTATALADRIESLRYVLLPNTLNAVPDLSLIQSATNVIQLPEGTTELPPYDVAVMYGLEEGWTSSDYLPTVALIVSSDNPLFENEAVLDVLRHSIAAEVVVEQLAINGAEAIMTETREPAALRTELANLGFPDGIVLTLGVGYVPGAAEVIEQLAAANIEVQSTLLGVNRIRDAFADNSLQAALVIWALPVEREGWVQRYGADNVIDLYSVPLSYKADPNLTVNLTPSGFPLVSLPTGANAEEALSTEENAGTAGNTSGG